MLSVYRSCQLSTLVNANFRIQEAVTYQKSTMVGRLTKGLNYGGFRCCVRQAPDMIRTRKISARIPIPQTTPVLYYLSVMKI